MKLLKIALPSVVLAAGFFAASFQSYATTAIAKKEGNAKCITCHEKAGKKDLNDTGKCYKTSKDLTACSTKT
jgi:hypothetical protein